MYRCAISWTNGSSGLGSVSIEQIESNTRKKHYSRCSVEGEERTFRNGQCWRPLVSKDVEANGAVGIDVWVVDLGRKADFGRFEGVVGGETDREEEDTTGVR